MNEHLGLDALLIALREQGLRVDVRASLRLREVLRRRPAFAAGDTRRGLRAILRTILVASREDQEILDRVFDAWMTDAEANFEIESPELPAQRASPSRETLSSKSKERGLSRRLLGVLALSTAVFIGVVVWMNYVPGQVEAPPPEISRETPSPPPELKQDFHEDLSPEEIRGRSTTIWTPVDVSVETSFWGQSRKVILPALILLLGAVSAFLMWRFLTARRRLPPAAPTPTRRGPPRAFLSVGEVPDLLSDEVCDGMAWGIGQYISHEETKRLDLKATVRATARAGGFPTLRFERARFHREVLLWIDDAAEDPAVRRLAKETADALRANGLPVETALFRGVPERLTRLREDDSLGDPFAPREMEERRGGALVVVLTDGRLLTRQRSSQTRTRQIDAVLQRLSLWPRLAFIDFSTEAVLAPLLKEREIEWLTPTEMPRFLHANAVPSPVADDDSEAVWEAACAAAPGPIDEASAQELREKLGIAPSAWAWRRLCKTSGKRRWLGEQRARRVNWLSAREENALRGTFGRVLEFWEERWTGLRGAFEISTARQHLDVEISLLKLWDRQETATKKLYSLWQGEQRDAVESALQGLAPNALGDGRQVEMLWKWEEISPLTRSMLREMKLGGRLPREQLERPGRFYIGWATAWSLGLGAALGLWMHPPMQEAPQFVGQENWPADAVQRIEPAADGLWNILVGSRQNILAFGMEGKNIEVVWQEQTVPCVETISPTGTPGEIWRCGAQLPRNRVVDERGRSIVVLEALPGGEAADRLASTLVGSGSADVVAIGEDVERFRQMFFGDLGPSESDQWLVLQPGSWDELAVGLRFSGIEQLAEVWPEAVVAEISPLDGFSLRGFEDRPGWVQIPAGTFGGKTIKSFLMMATEVTHEQFIAFRPDHESRWMREFKDTEQLPVTDVTWFDARDYCASQDARLPTEEEWEHAARAGTTTDWHFGDDESLIDDYAWYRDNSKNQVHEVGTKAPNPWRLYDMHGNVWEWTDSRYSEEETRRVLRGGSFANVPVNLRSAFRDGLEPENWFWSYGFRCVRGSGLQS